MSYSGYASFQGHPKFTVAQLDFSFASSLLNLLPAELLRNVIVKSRAKKR